MMAETNSLGYWISQVVGTSSDEEDGSTLGFLNNGDCTPARSDAEGGRPLLLTARVLLCRFRSAVTGLGGHDFMQLSPIGDQQIIIESIL